MTRDEGAQILRNAADHYILSTYETARGLEAIEAGMTVGVLLKAANDLDGRGIPQLVLYRFMELKRVNEK